MKRSKHQAPNSRETPNFKCQTRGALVFVMLGLGAFGTGIWSSFAAETTNSGIGRTDYRNFEIIPKRNIFNPRRSPAYVPSERPQTVRRRTESLALVGVMSYGKGPMAFFDGSRSDYRKMLKPNESIAGFKVTAIDATSVKLAASTNEIELQLGMQLAREEEGEWKLSMRPESLESTYARATPLRSASQINADRQSEAEQNSNPFANAIGNFFGNRGNGFPFPGGGNGFTGFPNQTTPADTQTQPVVIAAPANAGDVLARMARQAALERGGSPDQSTGATSDPGGGQPINPRGRSLQPPQNQQAPQPIQDSNGQLPINQPGQPQPGQPNQPQLVQPDQQQPDQSGQQPSDQTAQPLLDQFGQPVLDQSGRPILIQPGQQQPNQ